jgi:hypothetical protein
MGMAVAGRVAERPMHEKQHLLSRSTGTAAGQCRTTCMASPQSLAEACSTYSSEVQSKDGSLPPPPKATRAARRSGSGSGSGSGSALCLPVVSFVHSVPASQHSDSALRSQQQGRTRDRQGRSSQRRSSIDV